MLVLASVTFLTLDFRGDDGVLSGVRDGVLGIVAPIRGGVEWATSPVADAWGGAFGYDDLERENEALRAQVQELEREVLLAAEQRRRLDVLERLDAITAGSDVPGVDASVVDAPVIDFERTVELDVGADAGIAEGMPVVGPGGLIGRVTQVSGERSRAQLLTDATFAAGVRLSRSGETGVAQGRGRAEPLRVELLASDTPVIPGETVTTSGLAGSTFPAGLLVGTVTRASFDDLDDLLVVEVVPAADLNRLDIVSVLLWLPDDEPPGVDGPAPTDAVAGQPTP